MYNTVLLNNFLDFLEGLNGFQTTVHPPRAHVCVERSEFFFKNEFSGTLIQSYDCMNLADFKFDRGKMASFDTKLGQK